MTPDGEVKVPNPIAYCPHCRAEIVAGYDDGRCLICGYVLPQDPPGDNGGKEGEGDG